MNQQILSQDEVDALLQGIAGDGDKPEAPPPSSDGVRPHDLATQERLVRPRMPALESVHERFARNLRSALATMIRRTPEVAIGAIRVLKYGAFLREIVVPTNFNLVAVKPLRGSALIVCEPNVVFAAVDALFGGAGRFPTRIEGREFSPAEQRVIRRLVDLIVAEYRRAWQGIYPIELAYQRSEMQPQFANIAMPSDTVVAASFALEIGESTGSIHLCIPYATLEPIRDVLYRSAHAGGSDPDERWLDLLKQELQCAEVELVAELATAQAKLEEVLAFKPGDFIELDLGPAIQAKVEGVPVFDCHYGTSNNRYAIRIDRLIASPHPGWLGDAHVR